MNLITTVLDLVGLALCIAAAMVAVWPYSAAGSLATGGVSLIGSSYVLVTLNARARDRAARRAGGAA